MTIEQVFVLTVVIALIAAIIQGRFSVATIFSSAAFMFYATGFISTDLLLRQFTNPGVIAVTLLMLISVVLNKSRLLEYFAGKMLRGSYRFALAKMLAVVGLHSAFLNNTAVVASLIGPVRSTCRADAARLLLPLSYVATIGGVLTLIGTSTNLLISGFVQGAGLPALGIMTPFPVGIALFAVCSLVMWVVFPVMLKPRRLGDKPKASYFIEARAMPESTLIGKSIAGAGLRELGDLFLTEIVRDGRLLAPVHPGTTIRANDLLVFSGDVTRLDLLTQFDGLRVLQDSAGIPTDNLLEVMVTGESVLINRTIKSVDFRAQFDAAVLAVKRSSRHLRENLGSMPLQAGDVLILAVGQDFDTRNNLERNFIAISRPTLGRYVETWKSVFALLAFVVTVFLAAVGVVEFVRGLLILLVLYMLTGLVRVNELRRNVPWHLLITIASALVVSQVLALTGVAGLLVSAVLDNVELTPFLAMLVIMLSTVLLTELMTNNAAAALMFPLALSTATSMDVSYMPFVMAVLYGASASFLTPHGYQTNLMVMAPGGYVPRDYLRAGAPITFVYVLTAALLIPHFFPFVL